MADLNASGAVVASYAQGAGIDEALASLAAAGTAFFEADGLGSITSLSGASGLTDTYTYNSFGVTTATGTNPNRFRYTGRERAPETGLYYYRARYYDAQTGRFLTEDALTGAGASKYAYSMNDPANRIDPSGLQTIVIVFWNNREHTGFLGEHTAVYVFNNGHPILYDPSGDSRIGPDPHPTNDICENEYANLSEYLYAHGQQTQGTYPEIFVFDTTAQQEAEIANRILQKGSPGFAHCAIAVSNVLHGIGPFHNLQEVRKPSALAEQLRVLEQPEILRRSIHNLLPKPPANWEQMK